MNDSNLNRHFTSSIILTSANKSQLIYLRTRISVLAFLNSLANNFKIRSASNSIPEEDHD